MAPATAAITIITGSEDGTARIWDCKSGKCTKVIGTVKKLKGFVSCVALPSMQVRAGWFVASAKIWQSGISLLLNAFRVFPVVQLYKMQCLITIKPSQILAVGAYPVLNRFDMNGTILSQIQYALQSAFSVSLHPSGVIAIGGYGGIVDVISQFGSHLCTFRSHCV